MNKTIVIITLLTLCLFGSACKKDDPVEEINVFQGCCGTEPTEFQVGDASIFMASLFTPNGDGFNDLYRPSVNGGVKEITDFRIYDRESELIFEKDTYVVGVDDWDGRVDGNTYNGLFSYQITVTDSSRNMAEFRGRGCAYACDTASSAISNLQNCLFPGQGVNGTANPIIPSESPSCFQ